MYCVLGDFGVWGLCYFRFREDERDGMEAGEMKERGKREREFVGGNSKGQDMGLFVRFKLLGWVGLATGWALRINGPKPS